MSQTPVVSEVLSAGLIVHVRIESENFGAWHLPSESGWRQRPGVLGVRVVEVLKGDLDSAAGDLVMVDVVERGSGSGVVLDYYGIWAQAGTAPGTELVGFCDGATDDLQSQLTDEHCQQLAEATAVLGDVRLALGLLRRHLTVDQLIAEASRSRADGGALFARFVWVRVRDAVIGSPDRFAALMRIAEDPATRTEAQDAYLLAAYEDATVTQSLSSELRARLARAMFRTALDPAGSELRDQLLGTFIPNLVQGHVPEALSDADVFADQDELAERVRADRDDPATSAYGADLSRWLSTEGSDE